ncbi:protein UPSTREAM OF FLC-like [Phoenix dactylifera]|uniref:Protein UPSTREAM OF FLC-like n=1 Tax=Phoenix dactylifera TaxID=42345 RepID=A0A8B7BYU0_PHODC|nr:protein UPSTREAM OF FLC-like [Phoenix dactylifera]
MAVSSRGKSELWGQERRTAERKASVVYYLSRDGQLEHPHFLEVPLSSTEGLYLRDVINRLCVLRGKEMAAMYSWSSRRRYKNGFVWFDLCEEDFVYPIHDQEYILKGSELFHLGNSSPTSEKPPEISNFVRDVSDIPVSRRKMTSWDSFDLNESTAYKSEPTGVTAVKFSDASTQTDGLRHGRRAPIGEDRQAETANPEPTELGTDEISPPPSPSSPETLVAVIKADGRIVAIRPEDRSHRTVGACPKGRARASAVLMHLISCGSISVKEQGISLVSQYRGRLPMEAVSGRMGLEDKKYFSGSLIETRGLGNGGVGEFTGLKRSASCNAARTLRMELSKEIEDDHAKCMPRKPKRGKERNLPITRGIHQSRRING